MPGPFYFAWVAEGTAFNSAVHNVEDEQIISFKVSQSESQFAGLNIVVKNPRIGLLNTGRNVWAWLSWFNGSSIVPLFYGRLIGIPDDVFAEVCTLQFIARPADYSAQKEALAATMRSLPEFDPVFLDEKAIAEPDSVLEARSALWHIDRITHELTISDIMTGEDGDLTFSGDDVPYASLKMQLSEPPLRKVAIDAIVSWEQKYSQSNMLVFDNQKFTVPTLGLAKIWPKQGANLGGGWYVSASEVRTSVDGIEVVSTSGSWRSEDGQQSSQYSVSGPQPMPDPYVRLITESKTSMTVAWNPGDTASSSASSSGVILATPLDVYGSLSFGYEASRQRVEHAKFTLEGNVQAIVTEPGEAEVETITVQGCDVGLPLNDGTTIYTPIGSQAHRSYFATPRGHQSIEYLLLLARARMLMRSRVVLVSFQMTLARAVELTLRKNAIVYDGRLPGGSAAGKIVKYEFGGDGATGAGIGTATIACAVGYGGTVFDVAGTPTYVAAGYVADGWQAEEGGQVALASSDVGYEPPVFLPGDDGLNFPLNKRSAFVAEPAVTYEGTLPNLSKLLRQQRRIHPGREYARDIADNDFNKTTVKDIQDLYAAHKTILGFTLKPVNGSRFEVDYDITVTTLEIPQGIDLEAGA